MKQIVKLTTSSNRAKPVWREPGMHYGRPHPALLDPALPGVRGKGTPESHILIGERIMWQLQWAPVVS